MLKLTVRAGEYLMLGEDIKLVFTGGSAGNMRILVEAPSSVNIARSTVLKKYGHITEEQEKKYHREPRTKQRC